MGPDPDVPPGRRETVLVVGASRGIGLELSAQYLAAGWSVRATTRTPQRPGALGQIGLGLVIHGLDVRSGADLTGLRTALDGVALDVLIHNAGVYHGVSAREMHEVNAVAPIRVADALIDRVAASGRGRIVLMTSQMGARRGASGSLGAYGDSKAALNDAFRRRASDWGRRGVVAIVMHPGWVRTDMGGASAPLGVAESVAGIRAVVDGLSADHHGRFWTWDGREHPW